MSYPIINHTLYSYKQFQLAARARQEKGLHIVMTNGVRSLKSDGTPKEPTIVVPKGLLAGTKVTHVLHYPDTDKTTKFRISTEDDYAHVQAYVEFYVSGNQSRVYYYLPKFPEGVLVPGHTSRTYSPGIIVFQLGVASDGITVYEDGVQTVANKLKNDYTKCTQHGFDEDVFCGATLLEMHITYKSDQSTVFDTDTFYTPSYLPISVGGFVMIEGSVDTSCTISVYKQNVFTKTGKVSELHVLLKFYSTKLLVSEEGKARSDVKEIGIPTIDYTKLLIVYRVITTGIKMKNFVMETGLIGITWPK